MMSHLYSHLPLLQIFLLVVKQGSFQGAANDLNLPRSSVSKKIQQLEQALGSPLFKRSTRQLLITEFGQQLLNEISDLPRLINKLDQLVDRTQTEVIGKVSINSSVLLGQQYLIPHVQTIRQRFPKVDLALNFNDEYVDLIADDVDIALRVGLLPDSSLIARQVGRKRWCWFASPEYLARSGMPKTPDDLKDHDVIIFKTKQSNVNTWGFKNQMGDVANMTFPPRLSTDNSRSLVEMTVSGLGISMLDPLTIKSELANNQLVPVLEQWQHPESQPIHLVSVVKEQRLRAVEEVWRFLADNVRIE